MIRWWWWKVTKWLKSHRMVKNTYLVKDGQWQCKDGAVWRAAHTQHKCVAHAKKNKMQYPIYNDIIEIQHKYSANAIQIKRERMPVQRQGWLDRRAAGNWHFHPKHQQPDTYYNWNSNTTQIQQYTTSTQHKQKAKTGNWRFLFSPIAAATGCNELT